MHIHSEGKKIIPPALLILAAFDVLIYFTLRNSPFIFYLLIAALLFLAVLIVYFFRVPERKIERNEKYILSPADGKIVEIRKVFEKEYFNSERLMVSVFMSVFNVHQNRAPVDGEVVYQNHKRGAFYPAFVEKSSELNERCSTVFKMKNGTEIMSRQIAGTVAKRIVTSKKQGHEVRQGEEYGFIRFGSRVDLFLPVNTEVDVQINQKTTGGKTVIATFK